MKTIIALIGKSGVGKTTLFKTLKKELKTLGGFPVNFLTPVTTRPKRDNEIDGVDYHFISYEDFTNRLMNNEFAEATVFNNWGFGTLLSEIKDNCYNIGIFNPDAIECLYDNATCNSDNNCFIINIQLDDSTRIKRLVNREEKVDLEEIYRRYKADEQDFCLLSDKFVFISYNNYQSPHCFTKFLTKMFNNAVNQKGLKL